MLSLVLCGFLPRTVLNKYFQYYTAAVCHYARRLCARNGRHWKGDILIIISIELLYFHYYLRESFWTNCSNAQLSPSVSVLPVTSDAACGCYFWVIWALFNYLLAVSDCKTWIARMDWDAPQWKAIFYIFVPCQRASRPYKTRKHGTWKGTSRGREEQQRRKEK